MTKETLTLREQATLCLELSLFLKAGADAAGALYLLAEEEIPAWLKKRFQQAAARMDGGEPLSKAMSEEQLLPEDAVSMLEVGERTGRLEDTLRSLAAYFDQKDETERSLRSALLYPSILLVVMLAVIVVLLVKVLPIFSRVYASLGAQMTGVAGGLFTFGQILDSILPIVLVLIAILALCMIVVSCVPDIRKKLYGMLQNQFGKSGISRKMHTARFAQALYMAISSGLTAEEAVESAGALLGNGTAEQTKCQTCREMLMNGHTLAESVKETGLLPGVECRLLALGTASGQEDTAAAEIAERLTKEAEDALSQQISRIEPILVIVTSLLVGMILLTVMLPLTQIMTTIG